MDKTVSNSGPSALEATINKSCEEDLPQSVLQNIFHDNFKANQKEMIDSLLTNKDTLSVIPTGGGKSLCYWIPGVINAGVTVVITPLIALMNDQVEKLKSYGIPVCHVTSTMQPEERDSVFHELTNRIPKYKFFYVTPEFALSAQAV